VDVDPVDPEIERLSVLYGLREDVPNVGVEGVEGVLGHLEALLSGDASDRPFLE
jgi:hypothetical protein